MDKTCQCSAQHKITSRLMNFYFKCVCVCWDVFFYNALGSKKVKNTELRSGGLESKGKHTQVDLGYGSF